MDTKDLRESAMHLGAYGTLDSDRCNQAADLIDQLRADLTEANERVTFWMDAHAQDCTELQGIRSHLSLTLAQRNEELLQTKAEATRYRETLKDIERDDIDTGETDMEWGLRLQRYARIALEGGE